MSAETQTAVLKFLEKRCMDVESRLEDLEYTLDACDWIDRFEDDKAWWIFKNEAVTSRALMNQAKTIIPGEDFIGLIKAWKAQIAITTDSIERLCLDRLLTFLRDNNLDASE